MIYLLVMSNSDKVFLIGMYPMQHHRRQFGVSLNYDTPKRDFSIQK